MPRALLPELGESLATARRARGWTMERLAAEADVAVGTVRSAERGHPPNLENLIKLARALETTVGALLREPEAGEVSAEVAEVSRIVESLAPDDIELLRSLAERLASRSADSQPLPIPRGVRRDEWERLTHGEQEAIIEGLEFQERTSRLSEAAGSARAAESGTEYEAGRRDAEARARPGGSSRRGRSSRGGAGGGAGA